MKGKLIILIVIISCIPFLCSSQNINPEQSVVNFKVSNLGANKVKGTFKGMQGSFKFEPGNISESFFKVCIDASTINTKMKKRDEHLKKIEYFDVENYPEICFLSNSVVNAGMSYIAKGVLNMHGESKNVEIVFNYSRNTYTGKLKVNRLDYKIGPKSGILVGKEVEITIVCVVN